MMSFYDYWYRKQRSNPHLNNEENKLTITIASLKKELQKAFDAGKAEGFQESHRSGNDYGAFKDLFKF